MKKRRNLIISILLVAALALGVGYASLTDTLDIQGTAEVNQAAAEESFNQDVYFSAVSTGTGYTASINADNNDKATFTVTGLKDKGETISITYTIKNDGDLPAVVTPKLLQNSNEAYFAITSDWESTAQTLAANSEKTITVNVTLKELPTTTQAASFNIELTAVAG